MTYLNILENKLSKTYTVSLYFIQGLLWCFTNDEHDEGEIDVIDNTPIKKDDVQNVVKNTTINDVIKKCMEDMEENLR